MTHEIAELLPFYANGTLAPDERARVETELATCTACADELRALETLAATLRARAAAEPFPQRAFDDALARINTPPLAAASARVVTAWWGTPARYAAAAALVLGISGAAVAAWHAHDAAVTETALASRGIADGTRSANVVYRVSPGPHIAEKRAAEPAGVADAAAQTGTLANPSVAAPHRLAKKARLDLLVRDVETALGGAQAAVRAAGGDVTALADATPAGGELHTASLTVELPAARLDDTLDRLAQLGAVQTRAIDADDVDAAIVDEEARLRNLRREETDLRTLMDKGGKVTDILTVQQNLSAVRGQIEQLDAQHARDLHRVATSTIAVALTEDRPGTAPATPGPGTRIEGAWHTGLTTLADTVVSLLSTIAWCLALSPVPLTLAGALYVASRLLVKRRATAP